MRKSTYSTMKEIYQRAWEELERFGFIRDDLELVFRNEVAKMKSTLNQYLSVRDVAQRLSLHPDTVRKFCRQGLLKSIKIGERYRVRELDLFDFIRERENPYIGIEGWEIIKLARRLKLQ